MGVESSEMGGKTTIPDEKLSQGHIDIPFEVIDKNEKSLEYPYLAKVQHNWRAICQLMDWQKDGKILDENAFIKARDPFAVVTSIQNKILEKGGELTHYGVDGKFGKETEDALRKVIEREMTNKSNSLPLDVLPKKSPAVASEEEETEKLANLKAFTDFFDRLDRIDARLEAAGLKEIKQGNSDITEADIVAYQTRGMQFREQLVTEEPRLKPLSQIGQNLISDVEEEIKKIDRLTIKSPTDRTKAMKEIGKTVANKMDSYKATMNDKELKKLFKEVDNEHWMTLFMEIICEIEAIGEVKFGKLLDSKDQDVKNIASDESHSLDIFPRVKLTVNKLPGNWGDLVHKGPITTGIFEFTYNDKPVIVNIDAQALTFGRKVTHLVLPSGAILDSITALSNGGLLFDIKMLGFSQKKELRYSELESTLKKIEKSSKGSRIDIGEGAYLEVVYDMSKL